MNPIHPTTGKPDTTLVAQAFSQLATDYKGGKSALSSALGKSANTLANELNPEQPNHKLGLVDAIYLMHIAHDARPLKAIAACLNHTVIGLGDFTATNDVELLDQYAKWHSEIGDVAREVSLALGDGRITRNEYHRVLKEGMDQIQQFFEFMARMEALIDD